MSFPVSLSREVPGVGHLSFLHAYRGSIAHGTYLPNTDPDSIDDKDTMSFCIGPPEIYTGLDQFGSRGTIEMKKDPWDIVIYEATKAISLLEKGNPNVISMLWLPDNLYIKRSPEGDYLLRNRNVFVGRHVYKPFAGYASAQLSKMERGAFNGYMGEKRRQLVKKHGYDTKNAAHLIRLLRMCAEFLKEGELLVQRPDAAELLAIKHGEWSLEKVKLESERLFRRAEEAYDRSTLPAKPDRERVNEICRDIIETRLGWRTTSINTLSR